MVYNAKFGRKPKAATYSLHEVEVHRVEPGMNVDNISRQNEGFPLDAPPTTITNDFRVDERLQLFFQLLPTRLSRERCSYLSELPEYPLRCTRSFRFHSRMSLTISDHISCCCFAVFFHARCIRELHQRLCDVLREKRRLPSGFYLRNLLLISRNVETRTTHESWYQLSEAGRTSYLSACLPARLFIRSEDRAACRSDARMGIQ